MSHCFRDKCIFAFYAEIQDRLQQAISAREPALCQLTVYFEFQSRKERRQEGQRCPKRRVAQTAIRLATAVITFRNKERNVRSPS